MKSYLWGYQEKELDEYYIDDFVWTRTDYERAYYDIIISNVGNNMSNKF